MTAIARWLHRHPLVPYLFITFGISWLGVAAIVGPSGIPGTPVDFERLIVPAVIAMLLGPPVGAIAATAIVQGREGLSRLRARALAWRVEARWYAVALLTAPMVVVLALLYVKSIDGSLRAGILTADDPRGHLIFGVAVGLAAGVFEEIGWTGFVTPVLRQRFDVARTGFVLGVVWGAWHLVASWWGSASAGVVPIAIYLPVVLFVLLVPYRILMVMVYERTQSLPLAVLMHAMLTGSLRIIEPIGLADWDLLTWQITTGLVAWAAVFGVAVFARRRVEA